MDATGLDVTHIPLSLYIHLPWCVRKCPYCDFNSHALRGPLDEAAMVDALLADASQEAAGVGSRSIGSLFIGGGTRRLLDGLAASLPLSSHAEITLEANPGTADAANFRDYRQAGVNRLSLGLQSLNDAHLRALGRIHDAAQARAAFELARQAGFDNINLDLMFGLPQQSEAEALDDLRRALAWQPEHLSWYQLTLEPNTAFHHAPPPLPDDDQIWNMQQQGQAMLAEAGYRQYEISAYARPGRRCRHNLNYWTFGDYLALGPGAHGKLSDARGVWRYHKARHPDQYLANQQRRGQYRLTLADLRLESLMNGLRLNQGMAMNQLLRHTGLSAAHFHKAAEHAQAAGLLEGWPDCLRATERGRNFLNELLQYFDEDD